MRLFSLSMVCVLLFAGLMAAACRDRQPPAETTDDVQRVISLAPSLTEIIVAIGAADRLVGRSSACDYPAEALANVPVVGGFGEPSLEALLARRPDLIVDVALADKNLEQRMRAAGLRRDHIPCGQLDEIPEAIRRLGTLLDRRDAAASLATELDTALARYRDAADRIPADKRPLVFVELWSDPLMTVGRQSFVAELIHLAGGRNMGDEQNSEYYYLSHEHVITRNPDIILLLYMAGSAPEKRLAQRIGWESMRAVRHGRIVSDLDADLLLRPGPRIFEGIAQLRRIFDDWTRPGNQDDTP